MSDPGDHSPPTARRRCHRPSFPSGAESDCSLSTSSTSGAGARSRLRRTHHHPIGGGETSAQRGRKRVKGQYGAHRATQSSPSPPPIYTHLASIPCPATSSRSLMNPPASTGHWRDERRPTRPRQRSNSTPPFPLTQHSAAQTTSISQPISASSSSTNWQTSSIQSLNESLVQSQSLFIQSLRDSTSCPSSSSASRPIISRSDVPPPTSFSSYEFSFISPTLVAPLELMEFSPLVDDHQQHQPGLTFSEGTSVVSELESIDDLDLENDSARMEDRGREPEGEAEEEEDEMVMVVMRNEPDFGLEGCFGRTGKVDELSSLLRRTHLPPTTSPRSTQCDHPSDALKQRTWSEGELDMGGLFD